MKNIKEYNLDELKNEMEALGEKKYRAEQIFKWIYVDKVKEFEEMTNLSIELREKLKQNYNNKNKIKISISKLENIYYNY